MHSRHQVLELSATGVARDEISAEEYSAELHGALVESGMYQYYGIVAIVELLMSHYAWIQYEIAILMSQYRYRYACDISLLFSLLFSRAAPPRAISTATCQNLTALSAKSHCGSKATAKTTRLCRTPTLQLLEGCDRLTVV